MAFSLPRRSSMLVSIVFVGAIALSITQILTLQQAYVITKPYLEAALDTSDSRKSAYYTDFVKTEMKQTPMVYYFAIAVAVASALGLFSIMFT
jgi:hypothetical protein